MIEGSPMPKPAPSAIWSDIESPPSLLAGVLQLIVPELLLTPLPQAVPLPPELPLLGPLPAVAVATVPRPRRGYRRQHLGLLGRIR